MKKKKVKKIADFKDDKSILKSNLLQHVIGGIVKGDDRCEAQGSKYNDSVYVDH